jgi:hypothetical protein
MFQKFTLTLIAGAGVLTGVPGCTENGMPIPPPAPPPLATEPIGQQMSRAEPRLVGLPFRVLLDFERPTDMVFVTPQSAAAQRVSDHAHTGSSSMLCAPGAAFDVKLSSLLAGSAFPANWTLAGAYFSAGTAKSVTVTVSYRDAGASQPQLQRTVRLNGAQGWTPVFLDLTSRAGHADSQTGVLGFHVDGDQAIYCDDVTLINNARTLDAPDERAGPSGWTIRQGGYTIDVERPGRFRVTLKTPEAAEDGWNVEEADDLRARFVSASGKTWTIYSDGRQYQDGKYSALIDLGEASGLFAGQHAAPAEVLVPEEYGRIDRDTPGDQNNDAYNERRGSYQLVAKGPRFEVTLKPATRLLVRPVLEISGLPPGNALITVEGQLVEKSIRLPNGNLLVEIPLALERATTVNLIVK